MTVTNKQIGKWLMVLEGWGDDDDRKKPSREYNRIVKTMHPDHVYWNKLTGGEDLPNEYDHEGNEYFERPREVLNFPEIRAKLQSPQFEVEGKADAFKSIISSIYNEVPTINLQDTNEEVIDAGEILLKCASAAEAGTNVAANIGGAGLVRLANMICASFNQTIMTTTHAAYIGPNKDQKVERLYDFFSGKVHADLAIEIAVAQKSADALKHNFMLQRDRVGQSACEEFSRTISTLISAIDACVYNRFKARKATDRIHGMTEDDVDGRETMFINYFKKESAYGGSNPGKTVCVKQDGTLFPPQKQDSSSITFEWIPKGSVVLTQYKQGSDLVFQINTNDKSPALTSAQRATIQEMVDELYEKYNGKLYNKYPVQVGWDLPGIVKYTIKPQEIIQTPQQERPNYQPYRPPVAPAGRREYEPAPAPVEKMSGALANAFANRGNKQNKRR